MPEQDISIVIPVKGADDGQGPLLEILRPHFDDIIISRQGSRAASLNHGARQASHSKIWFLHADTILSQDNILKLKQAAYTYPDALLYYDLGFDAGGLVRLNARAANLRSRVFKLPYGDQGFCISKENFHALKGYPEDAPYGEDLLFVRQAKKRGVPITPVGSKIITSARRYHKAGWLKTTLLFQYKMWRLLCKKI